MDLLEKFFIAEQTDSNLSHLFLSKSLSDNSFKAFVENRLIEYNVECTVSRMKQKEEVLLNYKKLYVLIEAILKTHRSVKSKWASVNLGEQSVDIYLEGRRDSYIENSYKEVMKDVYLLPYVDDVRIMTKKVSTDRELNFRLFVSINTEKFVAYVLQLESEVVEKTQVITEVKDVVA